MVVQYDWTRGACGNALPPVHPHMLRGRTPAISRNETLWKVSLRVRSVRLDAGELDHLAPLLRFVGYELSKIGRRAWKRGGAQVGKPRLHLGIGEGLQRPRVVAGVG